MGKITSYIAETVANLTDYFVVVDESSTPTTKKVSLSTLLAAIFNPVNIPAGGGSPITRDNESQPAFVASGGGWTGDAYASTRNASMTALICYINGRRISINAVTARTFTASKDTYIDVLDNLDGTGTLVYTEVTNGAAAPALAANSVRIGKIITGVTTIAASTSILQYYQDSLGNMIYPRAVGTKVLDPNGWTVYYLAKGLQFLKTVTINQSLPNGAGVSLTLSSTNLPYGMATIGSNYLYGNAVVTSGNAFSFVWQFEMASSNAVLAATGTRIVAATATITANINVMIVTP